MNVLTDGQVPTELRKILVNEVVPKALNKEGFSEATDTDVLLGCCPQNAWITATVFDAHGYTVRIGLGALNLGLPGEEPETFSEVCKLGHNHVWTEVKYNNTWYVVEPCADVDSQNAGMPLLMNTLPEDYLFDSIDGAKYLTSIPSSVTDIKTQL